MLQFLRKLEAKWLESFLFTRQSQFWLAFGAWRVLIVDPDKAAELLNTSERPNDPKSAMILKYRKGSRYSLAVLQLHQKSEGSDWLIRMLIQELLV